MSLPSGRMVRVLTYMDRYLAASSVSTIKKITWAGQTFGGNYESDGRLKGTLDIVKISCDTTSNTCSIPVPAPGFAVVYMSEAALAMTDSESIQTYTTSAVTKDRNTATYDPKALETSNGMSGANRPYVASTSWGSVKGRNIAARLSAPVNLLVGSLMWVSVMLS